MRSIDLIIYRAILDYKGSFGAERIAAQTRMMKVMRVYYGQATPRFRSKIAALLSR